MTAWGGVEGDKVLPRSFICSYKKGIKSDSDAQDFFSIEIPLSKRDSKRLLSGKRKNLDYVETNGSNKTNKIQDIGHRSSASNDIEIFDRSKIYSDCISGYVDCSRKYHKQSDNKKCLSDFTNCSQARILLPSLYKQQL